MKDFIKEVREYFKRCKIPTKQEFVEYYPKYLLAHRNKWNRFLHLLGNISTLSYIVTIAYLTSFSILYLPLFAFAPFVVYLFAWPAHKYVEKNKPDTLSRNPLLTKSCDQIMCYEMLTGRLEKRLQKNELQKNLCSSNKKGAKEELR